MMPVTAPFKSMLAVAVVIDEQPVIVTVGAAVYPLPPAAMEIVSGSATYSPRFRERSLAALSTWNRYAVGSTASVG